MITRPQGRHGCYLLLTNRRVDAVQRLPLRVVSTKKSRKRQAFSLRVPLIIQNKCAIIYQRNSISNMHIKNLDLHSFRPICNIKKRCNFCKSCKSGSRDGGKDKERSPRCARDDGRLHVGLGFSPAAYLEYAYDAEGASPLRTRRFLHAQKSPRYPEGTM